MSDTSSAALYYDGDCAFCQACVRFVEKRDTQKRINLVPLQQSEHARADGCYESILFVKDGQQSQYSSAVVNILITLGGFWYLLSIFMWIIPRPLRDWVYRLVGKHRHGFLKNEDAKMKS